MRCSNEQKTVLYAEQNFQELKVNEEKGSGSFMIELL